MLGRSASSSGVSALYGVRSDAMTMTTAALPVSWRRDLSRSMHASARQGYSSLSSFRGGILVMHVTNQSASTRICGKAQVETAANSSASPDQPVAAVNVTGHCSRGATAGYGLLRCGHSATHRWCPYVSTEPRSLTLTSVAPAPIGGRRKTASIALML